MPLASNMTKLAIENPVSQPPGIAWEYNNHAVQAIEPIVRHATGMNPDAYIDTHLWQPLGMKATWKKDAQGQPAMYMNVRASCRDHARFGHLFLNRGCWAGEQILSEEWVEASTSPSTPMNQGYGYWWWLNGHNPTLDSVTFQDKGHMLHPTAPDDAFCAVGLGNQMIEVIPSLDLVIVRMGLAPHDDAALWASPWDLVAALLSDGQQHLHGEILERVLAAITDS